MSNVELRIHKLCIDPKTILLEFPSFPSPTGLKDSLKQRCYLVELQHWRILRFFEQLNDLKMIEIVSDFCECWIVWFCKDREMKLGVVQEIKNLEIFQLDDTDPMKDNLEKENKIDVEF